jgi:hypothetical protein
MERRLDQFPDWRVDIDEVSAGVYKLHAKGPKGHVVELVGTDPDLLLEQCKRELARMSAKQPQPK